MSRKALEMLVERFGEGVLETHDFRGDETAVVEPTIIAEAAAWLRDSDALAFDMLTDLTAVDCLPREPRFEVVYHFYSVTRKHRLRLKVRLPGDSPEVDTLSGVHTIANWLEREVYDMYGIRFAGHPDLRRILLYPEFSGHPLRKDYPKEKRQPLVRRPESELAELLARRGGGRPLTPIIPPAEGEQKD